MAKTLYEVFTGEKPDMQKTAWVNDMSVESLEERVKVLDSLLNDGRRTRRGLKTILKRQKQEILDELKRRNNEQQNTNTDNG